MTVRKIIILASGTLLISASLAAAVSAWQPWRQSELLDKKEVLSSVLRLYPGEVTKAELAGRVYRIGLTMETGDYLLEVDATDSSVLSIARNGKAAVSPAPNAGRDPGTSAMPSSSLQPGPTPTPVASDPSPGETDKPTVTDPPDAHPTGTTKPTTKPPALPGPEEAAGIALRHVAGTVEEVNLDGNHNYLVEIETGDGKEAVVQINRISGALMSVTWDDDDQEDDDRDDQDDDRDE